MTPSRRRGLPLIGGSLLVSASLVASAMVAVTPAGAAALPTWDASKLPAIATSPATGPSTPTITDDVVDGTYGTATSLQPILTWNAVPAGTAQVRFEIENLATGQPKLLWSASAAVRSGKAEAKVGAGILKDHRTYQWRAVSTSNAQVTDGPFPMRVDAQGANTQEISSIGPVAIAEATGEVMTTWSAPALTTVAGDLGWQLAYRPSNPAQPGVPTGWKLVVDGPSARFDELVNNSDGSVTLTEVTGWSVTFRLSSGGTYEPVFGQNQTWPSGASATLVKNADGTFTVNDESSSVTVFAAPVGQTPSRPTSVWSSTSPSAQQVWTDGRLAGLTDPVSRQAIDFTYAPSPDCPTPPPGFIPAPDGKLCRARLWTGNVIGVLYVNAGPHVQIGRIVSGLGASEASDSSDYGWDASGRLTNLRAPFASAVVASRAVGGLSDQDARAMTSIGYDSTGRVTSVTQPAGLVPGDQQTAHQSTRVVNTFAYTPTSFTARVTGLVTPSGFAKRDTISHQTFETTATSDESGVETIYTIDPATGSPMGWKTPSIGLEAKTTYNTDGQPVEEVGPTRYPLNSTAAPKTTVSYGLKADGTPITGLLATEWNNALFEGAPKKTSTGPIIGTASGPPGTLAYNWPSRPSGGTGPWSVRLTGSYVASTTGAHQFTSATNAKVWVNSIPCQPTCTVGIAAGAKAKLRLDVASADGGPAGVSLSVAPPSSGPSPIPLSALRPDLPFVSSETVRGQLSPNAPLQEFTSKYTYDVQTGHLLSSTSSGGVTTSETYLPYDPKNGQYGQMASQVNAAGVATTMNYYGATENAQAGCAADSVTNQAGLLKNVATVAGTYTSVHGSAGQVSTTSGPGSTTCAGEAASFPLASGSVTTTGAESAMSVSLPYVGNNPMISNETSFSRGVQTSVTVTRDLNGIVFSTEDEWGTTTTVDNDPLTGETIKVTETTALGETRVTTMTYRSDGNILTTAVGGKTLATYSYSSTTGALSRVTYANGTVADLTTDLNGHTTSVSYAFPNGKQASDAESFAVSGGVLSKRTVAPDGTASETFTSNRDGQLVATTETGTIPVKATGWTADFSGPQGANGDRQRLVTTTPGGTTTDTATYNTADQIVTAQHGDQSLPITYNAQGSATDVGPQHLSYDPNGELKTVTEGDKAFSFYTSGSGTIEMAYSFDAPPVAGPSTRASAPTTSSTTSTTVAPTTSSTTSTTVAPTTSTRSPGSSTSTSTSSPTTSTTAPLTTTTTAPGRKRTATGHTTPARQAIVVRASGNSLLLNDKGAIVGQQLSLEPGTQLVLDATGTPHTWIFADLQGNATWKVDAAGNLSPTELYDPYGQVISSNTPQVAPTTPLELVVATLQWGMDQGALTLPLPTPVVKLSSREYSPITGTFLQQDPSIQESVNAYAYVGGNPINGEDPTGNYAIIGDLIGGAVGFLATATLGRYSLGSGGVLKIGSKALAFGFDVGMLAVGAALGGGLTLAGDVAGQLLDTGTIDWSRAKIAGFSGLGVGILGLGTGRWLWAAGNVAAKLRAATAEEFAKNKMVWNPGKYFFNTKNQVSISKFKKPDSGGWFAFKYTLAGLFPAYAGAKYGPRAASKVTRQLKLSQTGSVGGYADNFSVADLRGILRGSRPLTAPKDVVEAITSNKQSIKAISDNLSNAGDKVTVFKIQYRPATNRISEKLPNKHASFSESADELTSHGSNYQDNVIQQFLLNELNGLH